MTAFAIAALVVALAALGALAAFLVAIARALIPLANYHRLVDDMNDRIERRVSERVKVVNRLVAGETVSSGIPESPEEPPPMQTSVVDELHEIQRDMNRRVRVGAPPVRDDFPDPPMSEW